MSPDPRPLVGIRYRWGGRDPRTGLDCWGVVRALLPQVPDYVAASPADVPAVIAAQVSAWALAPEPRPGDVLVLGLRPGDRQHVGVLTEHGVLHATRGLGVVLQPLAVVTQTYPHWEARRWA